MNAANKTPHTTVLIHGFWVTPRSWEHWKEHYEAKGYTVLTPAYPGFEVEVEAAPRRPHPDRQTGPSADHHGALSRRGVHPDLARSRVRRGRGGDRLRADRRREGRSALRDQVRVPHPEEPREPASSGRLHAEAVALRFREH